MYRILYFSGGKPRPSHLNRPLVGALPAHVGQNANLTCCLLSVPPNKRRGTVRGKAEKATKAKTACEQDKKNGRFHVKFLEWNEVDRGMGWEAYVPRASGGRTHARTYVRTHYWGRPVGTTGHIQLMRLGTTATAASIGR